MAVSPVSRDYVELHAHSFFSLLDGASSPEALVERAAALGYRALALTDHDSLAGAVRFSVAARAAGIHPIFGAELTLEPLAGGEPGHLTVLAETQRGYANLCWLLTRARRVTAQRDPADWPGKQEPRLRWEDLAARSDGLIALTGCRAGAVSRALLAGDAPAARAAAQRLIDIFSRERLFVELQQHALRGEAPLLRAQLELAAAAGLRVVATHNVHYATRDESRLRDALLSIRHLESLEQCRRSGRLPLNSTYALAHPAEMQARFDELPAALRMTGEIAGRCAASVDFSHQRLPAFAVPDGLNEFEYLYQLCHAALPRKYPRLTAQVLKQVAHELDVIERAGLAGYFLIVWDIARFARERGIRCQGRGSSGNSVITYLLDITVTDPIRHQLLFERFLSDDRHTMPDIDIDFAADRREEVIQYVYQRYGAAHVAMACNYVTFRARSALRDLGRALDFPVPVVERLIQQADTHSPREAAGRIAQLVTDADTGATPHPLRQLAGLLRMIDGCPRHLSIHSSGMVITGPPLEEVVPLEPASMPGRVVCEWDKDSLEDAGLIKIDVLGLGGLSMISTAAAMVAARVPGFDVDAIPHDDAATFEMIHRADTIGTFQVESRAQQQMLPRTRPATLEDLAVEVAIVRPGPIQGGAVHPYLRRRSGEEAVSYLHPALEPVLRETLGVLLYQEQCIRVAMVIAGFSASEADQLRRAMTRSRSGEAMLALSGRFMRGATERGVAADVAAQIFSNVAGFSGYGFSKPHAMSFAWIAYQSVWLKRHHPAEFYCALLNHQPMGFYPPEVIIGDAGRHGVKLLPPDVNRSGLDYTIEGGHLRTGLSAVAGFSDAAWERLGAARARGPFAGLRALSARARLPRSLLSDLIRAGACDTLGERRAMLWQLGDLPDVPDALGFEVPFSEAALPVLEPLERTMWEYELLGLSPDGQIMRHFRAALRAAGVLSAADARNARNGRRVRVAGMLVVRQRPATANGMQFAQLEDETGNIDVVIRPDVYAAHKAAIRSEQVWLAEGVAQQANGACSLLAVRITGLNV